MVLRDYARNEKELAVVRGEIGRGELRDGGGGGALTFATGGDLMGMTLCGGGDNADSGVAEERRVSNCTTIGREFELCVRMLPPVKAQVK